VTYYDGPRQPSPLEVLWGLWNRLEQLGATVHRIAFDRHAWRDARIPPLAAAARERLRVLEAAEDHPPPQE
jgi:hypothetical protein